jgi:hypothetical protein
MKVEIHIEKKHLLTLMGFIIAITAINLVIAYGGNQPSVVGHSVGELDLGPITVSGDKVGIGTTEPESPLHIEIPNTGTNHIRLTRDGGNEQLDISGRQGIRSYKNTFGIGTGDAFDFNLMTNNNNRITIKSNGNVGIGTTNPAGKLDVHGSICMSGDCRSNWPTGITCNWHGWRTNGNTYCHHAFEDVTPYTCMQFYCDGSHITHVRLHTCVDCGTY